MQIVLAATSIQSPVFTFPFDSPSKAVYTRQYDRIFKLEARSNPVQTMEIYIDPTICIEESLRDAADHHNAKRMCPEN
jgi:hypothetical protein